MNESSDQRIKAQSGSSSGSSIHASPPGGIAALWLLLRDSLLAWNAHDASQLGAALAFYTLFSIAPLLMMVESLSGLVISEARARNELLSQLNGLLGTAAASTIAGALDRLHEHSQGWRGTLLSLGVIVIGATSVLSELQHAMDRIWGPQPSASPKSLAGVTTWLRRRLISLGMVLVIGFLLIVSLSISAMLAALGRAWSGWLVNMVPLAYLLEMGLSFALLTSMFAMIYRWLPAQQLAWDDVWMGGLMTSLLFTAGKGLIGYYIGHSTAVADFGAAASLIVMLLWVYFSAQIFLFGAELTRIYAYRHGSLAPRSAQEPERRPTLKAEAKMTGDADAPGRGY